MAWLKLIRRSYNKAGFEKSLGVVNLEINYRNICISRFEVIRGYILES